MPSFSNLNVWHWTLVLNLKTTLPSFIGPMTLTSPICFLPSLITSFTLFSICMVWVASLTFTKAPEHLWYPPASSKFHLQRHSSSSLFDSLSIVWVLILLFQPCFVWSLVSRLLLRSRFSDLPQLPCYSNCSGIFSAFLALPFWFTCLRYHAYSCCLQLGVSPPSLVHYSIPDTFILARLVIIMPRSSLVYLVLSPSSFMLFHFSKVLH